MSVDTETQRLTARAQEIAARETKSLLDRTLASAKLYERAVRVLPKGVASNFQANDPYPIYLDHGRGSHVWDVDGTEYRDYHGGFGVNVVGHAHPKIVEAIERAAREGVHFAVTTEVTVALAEEICRRFGLEQMRYVNSGTEATMDAIRAARAATGRETILKIEGSYHGHHDAVLFSVVPEADRLELRGKVSGVVLIFDEVKSGATIAAGGAIERFGVQPDLVCVAKAMGGGTTIGAFGGRASVMEVVGKGAAQQGTFNGNPLSCRAGLVALTEILTPDAYEHLAKLGGLLAEGCQRAIDEHGIPAHTIDLGAKGCVSYRREPLTNYRDFLECNVDLFAAS